MNTYAQWHRTASAILRSIGINALTLVAGQLLLSPALSWGQVPRVLADEVREFEVLVKGKPTGKTTIRITEFDDGRTIAATEANVHVDLIVYTYRYEFHGKETWRDNRLVEAENSAIDGSKRLAVRARSSARESVIEIKGSKPRTGPALTMTTSYWRLPETADLRNGFSVMNADQGTTHAVKLESVETDQVVIDGRKVACAHYRLRGGLEADLWFDGQNRLVRQKTVEDGYPTELRPTRVVRILPPVAQR